MRKIILLFSVFTMNLSFSQVLPSAAIEPEYNEFGDPITNIMDANGARQGEWYYEDFFGKPILKEIYQDHKLVSVFYPELTVNSEVEKWVDQSNWEADLTILQKLRDKIYSLNLFSNLQSDRQVAIILLKSGDSRIAPLGNWKIEEANELVKNFNKESANFNLNLNQDVFILF